MRVLRLILLVLATFATAFGLLGPQTSSAQIFNSTWNGGTGDWIDPGNWSTVKFPKNQGTEYYNVAITGGGDVVNMAGIHAIDSLDLGLGSLLDINNNSTLTIVKDSSRASSGFFTNAGDIQLNATSLGATLRFDGSVTLTGGGSILLGNDSGNQFTGVNNGELINEDNTIRGSGTIGTSNTLSFVNRGIVEANQSVPLSIVLGAGVSNENIFRSVSGGNLILGGDVLENATGTIEAKTGSIVTFSGTTVNGGLLRTEGTGELIAKGLTEFDSSSDQVTIDGKVSINNNNSLYLIGNIINKKSINLNATSLNSNLVFRGTSELSGGGTINMANDAGNQITGQNNGKLINQDHLIRGSGTIGTSNTLELINNSIIEADQAVPLSIVAGPGVDNNGTLRAKSGGTLNLSGGIFANDAGAIEAADASTVNLQSVTIQGGMLHTLGSGVFNAAATTLDGSSSAVTLDGTMNIANNQTLTVMGDLFNQSNTINLNATSLAANLRFSGTVNLSGGGTVQLSNDSGNQLIGQSAGVLNNIDNLITGSGTIGTSSSLQVINGGVIEADQSTPLTLIGSPGFTNNNMIRAIDGATLNLSFGTFDNQLGEISATNGSTIALGTSTVQGGLLKADASSIITVVNSTLDGTTSVLTMDGTTTVGNNQTLTLKGDIRNKSNTILLNATSLTSNVRIDGRVNLEGGGSVVMGNDTGNRIYGQNGAHLINVNNSIMGSGNFGLNTMQVTNQGMIHANQTVGMTLDPNSNGFLNDFGGTIRVSSPGGMNFAAGGHVNRGSIQVDPGRTLTINGGANFVNDGGNVDIGAGSTVIVTGNYTQDGGITNNNGTLTSSLLNDFNGGTLTGNAIVNGDSDFDAAATIAAGNSAGIINFFDELTMGGTFEIELGGTLVDGVSQNTGQTNTGSDPGLIEFDQVNVFDFVNLQDGVILDVSRIGGFNPQVGDFFDVLTGDDITLLGSLEIQTDSAGLTFSSSVETLFDATTGTDRDVLRLTTVTAVPEPTSAMAIGLVLLIASQVLRRRQ